MQSLEAIDYLETLQKGQFLTVNIPILGDDMIKVTAMYVGKDKEGRYNFIDNGNFILSKDFLEKGKVTIDKEYDGDIAIDIHAKVRLELERKKHKNKIKDTR